MASLTIFNTNDTLSVSITSTSCSNPLYATYVLYKNGISYQTGTISATGGTLGQHGLGVYSIDVTIFEGDPAFPCDTGFAEGAQIDVILECIPSGQTNMSFSTLADFYNLDTAELLLSGPNNPASGATIFGLSGLPSTGTISKTRPNAVSELRGDCRYVSNGVFSYETYLENNFTKFSVDFSGNIYPGIWEKQVYDLVWLSQANGRTVTCPSNNSSTTFYIYLEHYNTSGTVIYNTPFFIRILKNGSLVDSISRSAGTNGSTNKTVTVSLSQGDYVEVEFYTQVDVFAGNCGRTLNYKTEVTIKESKVNNVENFIRNGGAGGVRVLDSEACATNTTLTYGFFEVGNPQYGGIFGELELYVDNTLVDTISSGVVKSRVVAGNKPVKIRTKYSGNSIDSAYLNPKIISTTRLNSNPRIPTTQDITSGVPSFLETTVTTPSSGVNTLEMIGSFTFTFVPADNVCNSTITDTVGNQQYITDTIIQLGTATGKVVFKAIPYSVPDRFQVIWNNEIVIDTGYISRDPSPSSWLGPLNEALTDLGEPTVDNIKYVLFRERETFTKNLSSPSTAIVRVFNPLITRLETKQLVLIDQTYNNWRFTLGCPS
jgi:hypothetical protein